MYKKVTPQILEELSTIVGRANVLSDSERMFDYGHDEFSLQDISHLPDVVVKPASAAEVASILRLASKESIPVTPRGGATGLCGGCVPVQGGIVLSLERMNRIL
jgi:glycolate oxidase